MESSSAAQNPSKMRRDESDKNRISQLPDVILDIILSFLHVNEAIKTCIFSRRWRNVWASMPYLTLTVEMFLPVKNNKGKFKHFINMLLLSRDTSNLHTFFWWWYNDFDPLILDTWICFSVKHNVRVWEIGIDEHYQPVELPDCFFTCQLLDEFKYTYASSLPIFCSGIHKARSVIKVVPLRFSNRQFSGDIHVWMPCPGRLGTSSLYICHS